MQRTKQTKQPEKKVYERSVQLEKEIDLLVNKYSWGDSKELFKAELQYLVAIAERDQMVKDHEATMNRLTTK